MSEIRQVEAFARGDVFVRRVRVCAHPDVLPVESVIDGSVLAWLCPDCDKQLPEGWQP